MDPGKDLWVSRPEKPGQREECEIDISNVTELELRVECLGGEAFAVWEEPILFANRSSNKKDSETLAPTFKNSLGMEFVLVPNGKSWLGGGGGRPGDKEVEILHDFYLGKYEVTQAEWEKVMGANPSWFAPKGNGKEAVKDVPAADLERFPVENVSWDATQLFLAGLNKRAKEVGWVYRLPKEMEWEYACRGGPMTGKVDGSFDFYFEKPTDQLLPEQANFDHGKGMKRTCKVGSYKPNRLGLYDMHGNVFEWCDDAENTPFGWGRVLRGGLFARDSGSCRAASRDTYGAGGQGGGMGFRVARVPVGKESK